MTVAILITNIIKDYGNFYPQIFLKEALVSYKVISVVV